MLGIAVTHGIYVIWREKAAACVSAIASNKTAKADPTKLNNAFLRAETCLVPQERVCVYVTVHVLSARVSLQGGNPHPA